MLLLKEKEVLSIIAINEQNPLAKARGFVFAPSLRYNKGVDSKEKRIIVALKSITESKAELEFQLLESQVPDALVLPFKSEIIAIVEKFEQSGQSGASAHYVAKAISQCVESLLLHKPILDITGFPEEWGESLGGSGYQNKRLSSVFKKTEDSQPYYLDAIVFVGDKTGAFTGAINMPDGSRLTSCQYIKSFPFNPKTFYVDVTETEWADEVETVEKEGGGWWSSIVTDLKQVDAVWEYYDRYYSHENK